MAANQSKLLSTALLHALAPKTAELTGTELNAIKKEVNNETLKWNNGRFSKKENKILDRNWRKFCDDYLVAKPYYAFGFFLNSANTSKEDKDRAQYLRNDCHLFQRLAKGLSHRTIREIYQRCRQIYSGLDRAKDLSEKKRQKVIKLSKKFPNEWTKIAEKTLCHPKSIQQIIRSGFVEIRGKLEIVRNGKWSAKEEKRLIRIIKKRLNVTTLSLSYARVVERKDWAFWTSVASRVKTRNANQCRQHWLSKFCFRVFDGESKQNHNWRKKMDTLKLLTFLIKKNYKYEHQIKWNIFVKEFTHVTNYNEIKRIWRQIKDIVPKQSKLKFKQLVDYIYLKKLNQYNVTNNDMAILEQFWREIMEH